MITVIILVLIGGLFYKGFALDSSVTILPAPPQNAVATQLDSTHVQLTWDASPTLASSIDSYTIFYKLKTDASYPASPQITRNDSLGSYSEIITVLPDTGYDFKIYANTASGLKSTDSCASCEASNAVCGNAIFEPGEECEGLDLQGAMCTDFGYKGGTLTCSPSCTYQFNSCISSGGGGGTAIDLTSPVVGDLTAPHYANTGPITVSYQGVIDTGGSGLKAVKLYYKTGTDPWQDSGLILQGSNGTFNFIPPNDQSVTYYFAIQAIDQQGNVSPYPDQGQATTIFDNISPTVGSIKIPTNTSAPLTITYSDVVDPAITSVDHVELWYKEGDAGTWTNSQLTGMAGDGAFVFNGFNGSGLYYFDVVAIDLAGNRSTENQETTIGVVYDHDPPIYQSLTAGPIVNQSVKLYYQGAVDVGLAGLGQVELWFKKDFDGQWMATGLSNASSIGDFDFMLSEGEGTYYFALVLTDQFGNISAYPKANGSLAVVYMQHPFEVFLNNLPGSVTSDNTTNIYVSGPEVVAYRYQINNGPYSDEIPIQNPIQLENLPEGNYTLSVLTKHQDGQWQDPLLPTTYQWTVEFQTPGFIITGPFVDEANPSQVTYTLTYQGEGIIDLTASDLLLNHTDTASGQLTVKEQGENTWQVILTNVSGEGELFFTLAPGLKDIQGKDIPSVVSATYLVTQLPKEEMQKEPENLQNVIKLLTTVSKIVPPAPSLEPTFAKVVQAAIDSIEKTPHLPGRSLFASTLSYEEQRQDCQRHYPMMDFEDEALDSDNDGLSNRTECYLGTNPSLPDTDDDECLDGDEVNWLDLNPLQNDCPFSRGKRAVWITSPQNDWYISRLEVMGLTPDNTSSLSLFLFPVIEGVADKNAVIPLGVIKGFSESSIPQHYFFVDEPKTSLKQGQQYELLAVSVLFDGSTLASPPVRFTYDQSASLNPPVPLTIGDRNISQTLKLTNVHVSQSDTGKVRVTGESEYGAQVFAMWQSIVLASSVITDSQLGHFSIESPVPLEPDQAHQVILYAIKEKDQHMVRSPSVEVNFYLHLLRWIYYLFIIILLRIILLFIIKKLQKNERILTKAKK